MTFLETRKSQVSALVFSLLSLCAFDPYAHLEQSTSNADAKASLEVGPRRPNTLRLTWVQAWRYYGRWLELKEAFANVAKTDRACSDIVQLTLARSSALVDSHIKDFELLCLNTKEADLSCSNEVERIEESERALSDFLSTEEACLGKSLSLAPANFGTNHFDGSVGIAGSTQGGTFIHRNLFGPELIMHYDGFDPESDFQSQTTLSTKANFQSGPTLLSYNLASDEGWRFKRAYVNASFRSTQEAGQWLEDQSQSQYLRRSGLVADFSAPLETYFVKVLYGFDVIQATNDVYAGFENFFEASFVLFKNWQKEEAFTFSGQIFNPEDDALMPRWQALNLNYSLKGLFRNGGWGSAKVGISERRSSTGFVRLYPDIDLLMESKPRLGSAWESRFLGSQTFKSKVELLVYGHDTWASTSTFTYELKPQITWMWQGFDLNLAVEASVNKDQDLPVQGRNETLLGVSLAPHYHLSKNFGLNANLSWSQTVLLSGGNVDQRLWLYPSASNNTWFISLGAAYEF